MIALLAAALAMAAPHGDKLTPCQLVHESGARAQALCADVPMADGDPGTVGVAVFNATVKGALPPPIVLLSGGPGQSATRDFVSMRAVIDRFRMDRDVVLIDIRGVGRSKPLLTCVDARPLQEKLKSDDEEESLKDLKRCLDSQPFDLKKITTGHIIKDIDAVRAFLGYARWHVLGISYGTRVAAMYGHAYPAHTASLILDGVVPLDRALGDDISADMEASLTAIGADDTVQFKKLKARLKEQPQELSVAHPTTGEVVQLTVTPDVVNVTVRMMLYADETRAVLPAMLRATQVAPLAAMAISTTSQLEGTIHTPVNLAIICAEDVPFMTNTPLPPDAAFDDERPGMKKACALFDAAKVEPFRPKSITPPTLMLSGEHDPITPPHHAKRSEGVFANLHHLVLKGQGHCMTVRGCAPKLIAEAIAAVDHNVSYDTVDASCLDKLPPFPRFIDALGPAP